MFNFQKSELDQTNEIPKTNAINVLSKDGLQIDQRIIILRIY